MKKIIIAMLSFVLLLSACSDNDDYVATVGKQRISENELEFYLKNVKSQMQGTELSSDEDWKDHEIEGRKAIEIAKEKALETAINNVSYIEVGKALGIKLDSDDKKLLKDNKEQFKSQFGSDKNYREFLDENDITDKFIDMLCEAMIYETKLSEKSAAENPATDEDISVYFNENKDELVEEYRKAKHILILTKNMETGEEFTEVQKSEAKIKAEGILERVKAGEDFDMLASEFSEDPGLETNPGGYVFGSGEMVPEFETGVDELGYNEIGFIESDFGYHILMRLPLEENDVKDRISSLVTMDKLNEYIEKMRSEYNIEINVNNEAINDID